MAAKWPPVSKSDQRVMVLAASVQRRMATSVLNGHPGGHRAALDLLPPATGMGALGSTGWPTSRPCR